MSDALLEVEGLETAYGASQVLFGLSLDDPGRRGRDAARAQRHGQDDHRALDPRPDAAARRCDHVPRRAHRAPRGRRIARAGIALVPEGRQIFPNLTVRENLVAFADNRCGARAPWNLERVYALFPRLQERAENMGNQLSGGEQQMLAIGRALMTNPHLLDSRRGDRRPGAADPRGDLALPRRPQGGRPDDPGHRQVRRAPGARGRPAHHHRARPRGVAGRLQRAGRRSRAVAPVSRSLSRANCRNSLRFRTVSGRTACVTRGEPCDCATSIVRACLPR